ncbi:Peptidase M16C associated [Trinorchestia longiramus]|nr:Peptidase M16C associated [Trinorchestia longiramus]
MLLVPQLRAAARALAAVRSSWLHSRQTPRWGCPVSYSTQCQAGEAVRSVASVGSDLHGFRVLQVQELAELQLTAVRLQHISTAADYLHIAKDDPNNAFCIGFRTTPLDSTGVPHILEHTVLCGSEKYPVRDPFFKMLNRSLSTFMNAMTGSDYTIYPFSTQNPTDFRNLMSVYLDAVFKPNLSELDFCQEGWRLEHADPKNKNSPIEFKGVVFNEMKGVFADSQNIFMQKLQNGLLPSHTYGVVSGGNPLDIPSLTWYQLKKFHSYHYHPSNCRIYTYGNQNLEDHLSFINENYLRHFTKIEPHTEVPDEPIWSKPLSDHIHCGFDSLAPADAQKSVAISYRLADVTDISECFMLNILGELLVGGPNAPFYKSLLEPLHGSGFSSATGFCGHTRNTSFTIGLQGVKDGRAEVILTEIENTFERVKKEGFPKVRIEAILHSIELALKHQTPAFGVGLAMSLAPFWNQDGDPVKSLAINQAIDDFKKSLEENPRYLQEKVNQYFIKNKHKYTLHMSPTESFEKTLKEKEAALLKSHVDSLSDEDRQMIYDMGLKLAEKQQETEDLSCLPTLRPQDISRTIDRVQLSHMRFSDGVPVQASPQSTNGITYFRAVLDVQTLPPDLVPYVPLLCSVLTNMGAGGLDFREFDQQVELTTGGLSVSPHLQQHVHNYSIERGVLFSSYCLQKNVSHMFNLWEKILTEVNMENLSRFSTLVKMIATEKSNSVIHGGHSYAMQAASSSVSPYGAVREQWSGLTYVEQLKKLSETSNLKPVLIKLSQLAFVLLGKKCMRVAVNSSPEHMDSTLKELELFLDNLGGTPQNYETHPPLDESQFTPQTRRTHHVFPFPVNYASRSVAGVPYRHPDAGPLRVLGRLMFPFLHREIREKGGAYGGGASVSPGGPISFYSYRDPNSSQTFEAFNRALNWVLKGDFTQRDIDEAKLGVFQSIDAPIGPGSRGLRNFLAHITDDMFEEHRVSVLDSDAQDIMRVARTHLLDCHIEGACLIGPSNDSFKDDPFWECVQH